MRGNEYRTYEGSQLEESLALFAYDMHFRHVKGEGQQQAWLESHHIRTQLLKRLPLHKVQQQKASIRLSQEDFEELVAHRPKRFMLQGVAEFLALPEGFLVLSVADCTTLHVADFVTRIQANIRGYRRKNYECDLKTSLANCQDQFQAIYRQARRKYEPLKMTLSTYRATSTYQNTIPPQIKKISCSLQSK